MTKGSLYLIPSPISDNKFNAFPAISEALSNIQHFVIEKPKIARANLKALGYKKPIQEAVFYELNKHSDKSKTESYLNICLEGKNLALLSDAGCPGVADPGAELVALAHKLDIRTIPLVGPSSILLALMASGLNGQNFAFVGYLPKDSSERKRAINKLEDDMLKTGQTKIFIETPHRNSALFNDLLQNLSNKTKLTIARDLQSEDELVLTFNVLEWNNRNEELSLGKRPSVFLIGK